LWKTGNDDNATPRTYLLLWPWAIEVLYNGNT
jgi:hypothetical protein